MALGERFRRHARRLADTLLTMRFLLLFPLAVSFSSSQSSPASAPAPIRLHPETIAVFDRYVRLTEERNEAELKRGSALLWIDSLAPAQRTEAYAGLKRGEVQIQQLIYP